MGNAGSGGNPFVRQTFGSSKWACHTPDKTYAMDLNHTWFARKCGKKGASRPQSAAIYKTFDAGARVQDCQIACQNDARCVAVETHNGHGAHHCEMWNQEPQFVAKANGYSCWRVKRHWKTYMQQTCKSAGRTVAP